MRLPSLHDPENAFNKRLEKVNFLVVISKDQSVGTQRRQLCQTLDNAENKGIDMIVSPITTKSRCIYLI